MTKEIIAIVAGILGIAGNVPYIRDMFRRKVEPHPYTWLVWTLVTGITFFGQLAKGAGVGTIPTAVALLFTILIFFFSLRYGFKRITRLDQVFLVSALIGIALWPITHDPTISVIVAVTIDLIAYIPTLRKTWLYPSTETPILYEMNVARHALALFSLQAYNVATMLHSITMIITNSVMTSLILLKKRSQTIMN